MRERDNRCTRGQTIGHHGEKDVSPSPLGWFTAPLFVFFAVNSSCELVRFSPAKNLDFRASWPSGLLIEPTIREDDAKNPFCIRQSYVARCPGRAGAAREVCRNFLRNGTVLKYLDDNTVVILRPNGVIVTCMDPDDDLPRSQDEFIHRAAQVSLEGIYTRIWVNCRDGRGERGKGDGEGKRKFFG